MSYFDQPRRTSERRNQASQSFRSPRLNRPAQQRGPTITTASVALGHVKWFNAEKGFGFVALEDGTDVFLHGSVLERAGLSVNQGDSVRVGVGQGLRGRQVTEVLEAKAAAAPSERHASATDSVRGVVKWWSEQKGFGFITPEMGTQDIFVHASTAARSGLSLEQGMPVKVKVRQGVKGPEAVEVAAA
jgi:cold shock protein